MGLLAMGELSIASLRKWLPSFFYSSSRRSGLRFVALAQAVLITAVHRVLPIESGEYGYASVGFDRCLPL